jgi:predicted secreted protein
MMIKNQFALLAGFLLLLFTVSCNPIGLFPTEEPPNGSQTVIVTPAPGSNETTLNLGDTLVLQIPTIPTEGYEWQVRDIDRTILVQEGEPTYAEDDSPDSAGGMVRLKFKAIRTGTTILNLEYVTSDPDQDPALSKETFGLTVIVKESRSETIIITPAIKGNSAVLDVGDTLEVQIPTIPSEGYQWQVRDLDPSILVQEGEATYEADTSSDSAGSIVTLRFKSVGPGKTSLSLEYNNAGSTTGPALSKDTFGMPVTVLGSHTVDVVITPGIKENSAALEVGEVLQVGIPTIPSEGYEWQVRDLDTSILVQQGSPEYVKDLTLDSTGGMYVLKFLAIGRGKTTLSLEYVNINANEELPFVKDTFGMIIEVK